MKPVPDLAIKRFHVQARLSQKTRRIPEARDQAWKLPN
jgi:hypothetical protein